jgi:SPP1 gp7 family putative phage head morphogenesis protein
VSVEFTDLVGNEVFQRIVASLGSRITDINETTREKVSAAIKEGLEAGDGAAQLGERVEQAAAFDEYRAEMVARTESTIVLNQSQIETFREYGVTHVEVIDGDDDEECAAANGQTWTLEEAQANPLAHPNCVRDFSPIVGREVEREREAEPEPTPLTFDSAEAADKWARDQYGDSKFVKYEGQVPTSGMLKDLPADELKALQDYSTSGYADLNSHLRGLGTENFTPEQLQTRFIEPLDSALARNPLPETVQLSRTTTLDAFGTNDLDSLIGSVVNEPGYMSTSIGPITREGWPIHMNITAPQGTPGIYVEPISRIKGEREMLLGRGLDYRVDAVRHTGKIAEHFAEEIIEVDVTIL